MTGVNCMWIINNSLDVIRVLKEKQLSLNHVSTWDFSTLYTSLPHAQLKKQLHDLLERFFNTKVSSCWVYEISGQEIEKAESCLCSTEFSFRFLLK